MSELLETALELHARGLPITLCPIGTKHPLGEGWDATSRGKQWHLKKWTKNEIKQAFKVRGELDVGLTLGPQSGVIDIETDGAEAGKLLQELLAGSAVVTPMYTSPRGSHRLYKWDPRFEEIGKAAVHYGSVNGPEVRLGAGGKAAQSLLPPSVTDGKARAWLPQLSLDDCPPASLPDEVVERLIEATKPRQSGDVYTEDTETQTLRQSVCTVSTEDAVSAAITATTPDGEGFRNRQIFNFVRRLKAIPELASANLDALKPIARQWHQKALRYITTKEFDVTWRDFCYAWQRARTAYGEGGRLADIWTASLKSPLPPAAARYETPVVKRLVGFCHQLQLDAGDKPFFLTCRDAGAMLGVSHRCANKWLNHLVVERVLEVAAIGRRGKGTDYRYVAE